MALLTDVLVAFPAEAEAICRAARHSEKWSCWESKGVDNLVFSDLARALGAEADAKALAGTGRLVYAQKDVGPWVFHLPDIVRMTLSALGDNRIPDLAERWVQGEEAADAGARVEDVVLALKELRTLSRQALAAGKSLLLRMSL